MRVGLGYDSHRFDPDCPCILGGVTIPDHPGLSGHSDGDAICHAVIDAILGATALGDVGSHFPPSDEQYRGADSMELLRRAVAVMSGAGWGVVNVDVTVVCETPKIGPVRDAIRANLSEALRVPLDCVSVKGKTNERMGWTGSGEGLMVHAVALVDRASGGDTADEAR